MQAYRRQRELAFCAPAKLEFVEHLLHRHRADRTLLFTQDNATAYKVSRRFLIPAITHQTKVRERSEILARLGDGSYGAVVTYNVVSRQGRRRGRERAHRELRSVVGTRAPDRAIRSLRRVRARQPAQP